MIEIFQFMDAPYLTNDEEGRETVQHTSGAFVSCDDYYALELKMFRISFAIKLEEMGRHYIIVGDEDIGKGLKKNSEKVLRCEKLITDGDTWITDAFAWVFQTIRLHPDKYAEMYNLIFDKPLVKV